MFPGIKSCRGYCPVVPIPDSSRAPGNLSTWWVYLIGPVVGAVIGLALSSAQADGSLAG
jgi:glycerol uptake facilitator-like aquaporin